MTTWHDDIDSESEYSGEAEFESDGSYDGEDARSDAARRERARRLALARQRMNRAQQARGRTTIARAPTAGATVTAIRNLDLETKVASDSMRRALEQAKRRATRATYATVASVAIDQALDTFSSTLAGHDYVRAGLRASPLLLLSPERRRHGVEGFVTDPRVLGVAGVAAVVIAGRFHNRGTSIAKIDVLPRKVPASGTGSFQAFALDKSGGFIAGQTITFSATDPTKLTVDANGNYTRISAGEVFVVATAGSHSELIRID